MDDLTKLARQHGSDKTDGHYYTPHYHQHFSHLRDSAINLLEIGIGGYDDPNAGGASLRMWQDYFPKAKIFGIDICDKSPHQTDRIKIFRGSQADPAFLKSVAAEIGEIHVIVDDGSHINEHVRISFETLFPILKEDGIYAVEDIQTSYWPQEGGDSFSLNKKTTTMGYFKSLVDGLNYEEFDDPFRATTYFDKNIRSLSFYHNLIFVHKGPNCEGSIANCLNPSRVAANRKSLRYLARWIRSRLSPK